MRYMDGHSLGLMCQTMDLTIAPIPRTSFENVSRRSESGSGHRRDQTLTAKPYQSHHPRILFDFLHDFLDSTWPCLLASS